MTPEEIARVAKGLSEAQRDALLSGGWNANPVCSELLATGVVKRMPSASWPYYVELSLIGLAVRAFLEAEGR